MRNKSYMDIHKNNPGGFSLQAARRVAAGVGASGIRDVFGEPVGLFWGAARLGGYNKTRCPYMTGILIDT